jgi:hypothetical protein
MTCRDEILETAKRIMHRNGESNFVLAELIDEMQKYGTTYQESTIRTHVTSRMCANAPDHHAVTYSDLERIAPGRYRVLGAAHSTQQADNPNGMAQTAVPPAAISPQKLLAKAVHIAAAAHENQIDKAGEAYILHPLRLMARARRNDERIVALLHDVVEDSDWTLGALAAEGFSPQVVDAIDCLTSRTGENYDDFIGRVLRNPLATRVKLLDIEDNMDMKRLGTLSEKDLARLQKYHAARRLLLGT